MHDDDNDMDNDYIGYLEKLKYEELQKQQSDEMEAIEIAKKSICNTDAGSG